MVILAVDLGKVRTGLAICDKDELLASPLKVITQSDTDLLCDEIADIALQHKCGIIVVGLPKNMDGSEGESAQNARAFADKLRVSSGLPVEMCDERGTTVTAHTYMNANNVRGKKRKSVVDSVAATIILEDYLSYRKNLKNRNA